ncbi:TBC1 domain family member 2A [Cyberlindnera fabianii]|nr:TBC1 domain family member 2A [Cyberlindnera fabianii]
MLNGYDEIHKTSIALFKISEERLLSMNDNVEIYEFMKNLNKANFNLKGSELIRISSSIKIE